MPELSDECFESLNFLANVYLTSSFAFKMIYECLEKDPLITIVTRKFRCLHRLARTNFQKTNNYLVEHGRCYIFRPNVGWSGVTYELGLILEEELQTQLNQVREIALAENNSRLVNFVDLLKGDNRPKAPPVDQPSSSQSQANKSENSANDKTEEEIEISIETKDDVSTITDDNDDDEGSKWNRESGSANETSSTNGQIDQEQFRRILVFNRPDPKTNLLAKDIITWLNSEFPHLEIISENDNSKIDLVIVIGGDGTLLKAVSTFTGVVPPILGFRGGNLNYLLYYDIKGYRNTFKSIFTRGIQFQTRSRLSCKLDGREWSAVNDVCLHRGSNAQTISVNIQIEGQEVLVKGDGIIISTATGSTAYAGSAGGSVVHPMLDCLQVTPICSANLWQHSIILPKTSNVKLELIDGPSVFNIDGQNMMQDLEAGKVVEVSMDATPIRFVISEGSPDASNHWINALRSKCRFD